MARAFRVTVAVVLTTTLAFGSIAPGAVGQAPSAKPGTLTARIDAAIAATAAESMFDVDSLRAWVAEHVRPEAYAGVLKGARGAYLTRSANDIDAAILMAALLDASLVPHRFALCELPGSPVESGTAELAAASDATGDRGARRGSAFPAIDAIDEILEVVTDPELRAALVAVPALREARLATSTEAARQLAAALGASPAAVAPTPASAATVAALPRRHVWLQAASGPEWHDVDPTTPTGEPPCTPTETLEQLPVEWYHRIRLALEVEQRIGGALSTSEAFAVELPTADVATSRMSIGFGESGGFFSGIQWAAGTLQRHTPVLVIDGQVTSGIPLFLPPSTATLSFADELSEALDIGLDPAASDGLPDEPDPVTGAWIRIDLVPPDGPASVLRSTIFDRLGVAARTSGDAETSEVRPLEEVLGAQADLGSMWQIAYLLGPTATPDGAADGAPDLTTEEGLATLLDSWLRVFPAAYRDLGGQGSGPMLILAGLRDESGLDGEPVSQIVLDALHVPGVPGLEPADTARDAQAVVGAEALLMDLVDLETVPLGDADAVFTAAREQGIPLIWLVPGDEVVVDGLSPDTRARIDERLASGASLLTPAAVPTLEGVAHTAWWLRDLGAGIVRDEHESGRHQMAERAVQEGQTLSWGERFRRLGCRIAGPLAIAGSILFGASGGTAGADIVKAAAKIATAADENRKRGEAARKIACLGTGGQGAP